MSFGKRFVTSLLTLAFVGTVLVPLIHSNPVQAYNQASKYSQDTLHIKLKNPNDINSPKLKSIFNAAGPVGKIVKLDGQPGNSQLQKSLNSALSDYYTVHFNHNVNMANLVSNLEGQSDVATAYPEVKAAPPPSTSPSFVSMQNYLNASPSGINANFARSFPGGTGSKVKLIDIEYDWNTNHEDLTKARTALRQVNSMNDPDPSGTGAWRDHGTAAIGEIVADNNSFGVTGAAPGVSLELLNIDSVQKGFDPVSALYVAALTSKPGDVIMLDMQTWGPNSEFLPIEWIPEVYDEIHAITASGRNVVEAAGDGMSYSIGMNLDDPIYGISFPMGKPDSGAIIVGAGLNCSGEFDLSREYMSNYGKRVNLQGPGDCVTTTGYGDLYSAGGTNATYTANFNGTSSATPVVAAAVADLSSAWIALNGSYLSPLYIRGILSGTGAPQLTSGAGVNTGKIGPMPNLAKALLLTDQIAPTAPANLKAILNASKKPVLTWTAATDNYKVSGYTIYRNGVKYATITGLTYTDVNVSLNSTYTYKIAANDPSDHVSAYSNQVSITVK